ncbi:MAG: hypothetical protein AAF399_05915 [Bacteroidota bacterium]
MKHLSSLFLSGLCWLILSSGSQLLAQNQANCRLKKADLRPIIARFNPFFADHTWDQENQMEMARLGEGRLLLITQDGCKRHHITFTLILDPSEVDQVSRDFWIQEVKALMHKVYWEQTGYEAFGEDFETAFVQKFQMYGVNRRFNFPVGTRNYICELLYDPTRGARINLEMVSFLFKEKIQERRRGIPEDQDDGWLGTRKDGH